MTGLLAASRAFLALIHREQLVHSGAEHVTVIASKTPVLISSELSEHPEQTVMFVPIHEDIFQTRGVSDLAEMGQTLSTVKTIFRVRRMKRYNNVTF